MDVGAGDLEECQEIGSPVSVFTESGCGLACVLTTLLMEEPEENSEEAKRAKRIIYWVMAVFIAVPLIGLLYVSFSG
ncbi:hypothetical protein VDG1235_3008 [Verrucomicrobiia bacterium DG1235]|nr:hypothetical protein VDG1235_3008 [Verrucomicrobiae bacterium DG1235]